MHVKHLGSDWRSFVRQAGWHFQPIKIFDGKSAQMILMEQGMALILSSIALGVYHGEDDKSHA